MSDPEPEPKFVFSDEPHDHDADKKKEKSLMKKMVIFSVGLLIITIVAYYFIEIHDWYSSDVLGDDTIECDSLQDCASKCSNGTFYHTSTSSCEIYPEIEPIQQFVPNDPQRCEGLISISSSMIKQNNNTKDITLWSQDEQDLILLIEEEYIRDCFPNPDELMIKVPSCTVTYITIQRLIDKMTENQLDSIPEWEQDIYNESYQAYFGNHCHKVIDQIEENPMFKEFNATRNGSD